MKNSFQRLAVNALLKSALVAILAVAIFLSSFLTFVHSIPPQGIESDVHWWLRFLIPSCLVSAIVVLSLPMIRPGGLGGALRSAALCFVVSTAVLLVQCGATMSAGSEQQAWFGIPALHVIFFSVVAAAIVGSLPIRRSV